MIDTTERSARIKTKAGELGFLACGIAEAGFLDTEAPRLERWLSEERNGAMSYMANHFDLRLDPRKLVLGAKSVISLAYNYFTPDKQEDPITPKLINGRPSRVRKPGMMVWKGRLPGATTFGLAASSEKPWPRFCSDSP